VGKAQRAHRFPAAREDGGHGANAPLPTILHPEHESQFFSPVNTNFGVSHLKRMASRRGSMPNKWAAGGTCKRAAGWSTT